MVIIGIDYIKYRNINNENLQVGTMLIEHSTILREGINLKTIARYQDTKYESYKQKPIGMKLQTSQNIKNLIEQISNT